MIEVGEYVRISWSGELGQITKELKDGWFKWKPAGYAYNKKIRLCEDDNRIKHSKNIIDLIRDTDILKVEINEEWVDKEESIKFIIVGQTYTIDEIKKDLENGIYKIKQILTKEQYNANCYRLGDD